MDVTLQKHGAKHIYKVPEGLRELCTDITREVLRSQPTEIYSFIADYIDALLITRENAKVAMKVVNNILKGSHTIMTILCQTGLTMEQIAAAAPRIQKAFRIYLDTIDGQRLDEDETFDETSRISIRDILKTTGFNVEQAEKAATIIQAAFRGHYTRMLVAESQGKIQWQRALMNTLNILRKAGVPQEEIIKSLPTIQVAYRGYYTNRNIRMQMTANQEISKKEEKAHDPIVDTGQTVQAVAWLEMVYQDSRLSFEIVNKAATVIQRAYKRHRIRRTSFGIQKVISSRSFVVEGILDVLRQNVFDKVTSRDDIPTEFGTREDMKKASKLLQQIYKDHLRHTKVSTGEKYEEEMETMPMDVEMNDMDVKKLDETIEGEEVTEHLETEDEESKIVDEIKEISTKDPTGEPIKLAEEKAEGDEREEEEKEREGEKEGVHEVERGKEQEKEHEEEQEEEQEKEVEQEKEYEEEQEEEQEKGVEQEKEEEQEKGKEQEEEQEQEEEKGEEQEVPHEATSASDTAG